MHIEGVRQGVRGPMLNIHLFFVMRHILQVLAWLTLSKKLTSLRFTGRQMDINGLRGKKAGRFSPSCWLLTHF